MNQNESAFPQYAQSGDMAVSKGGVTKRELFAAMALQGIMANSKVLEDATKAKNPRLFVDSSCGTAIVMADALLAELEKGKDQTKGAPKTIH